MSNRGQTVKQGGGNLVRVIEALNGFRVKHGSWPTELLIYPEALADLQDRHLTDLGFGLLKEKVRLVHANDLALIARDDEGRTFDYGSEGWSQDKPEEPAEVWLGLDRKSVV